MHDYCDECQQYEELIEVWDEDTNEVMYICEECYLEDE